MARSKSRDPGGSVFDRDLFSRVFLIRCGTRRGTAFSFDHDGRQYVVTASHLVRDLAVGKVLELFHGGKWKPLDAVITGQGPPQVDISVLALKFRISLPQTVLEPAKKELEPGQEVVCLGFPPGEWKIPEDSPHPFPIPFLKKGFVAYVSPPSSAIKCIFLECPADSGFSGGPVFVREGTSEGKKGTWRIRGVVSALAYDQKPVYVGDDWVHVTVMGNESNRTVAYDFKQALDLMNLNPVGFLLES